MLLLDDDPAFNEVIRDFLAECGYTVVAVQSGVEGVREVLVGDFALILCDMQMPSMPGDMFYRAVERICPRLCERFLFMTGYRGDAKTNEFIKNVNGLVLRKPFQLKDLEDSIAFIKSRPASRTVVAPAAPVTPGPPASAVPTVAPRLVAWAQIDLARAGESQPRAGVVSRTFAFAMVALCVAFVGGFVAWRSLLAAREGARSAELSTLSREWTAVSAQLQDANAVRPKIEAALGQPARIAADRARPRWTPALHGIAIQAERGVEILEIYARGEVEDSGACELRLRGAAVGLQPRLAADRFREAVEEHLKRNADGRAASVRFEQIEDAPDAPGALPDQRRGTFVIVAEVSPMKPPMAESGEGH